MAGPRPFRARLGGASPSPVMGGSTATGKSRRPCKHRGWQGQSHWTPRLLLGLALAWSKELVRGRSGRPLNCDLLLAAEPRRQSVVRVVTVDFFYRRAPAYSAELKPGNLVRVVASAGYSAPRRPRPLGRGVLNKHQLFRSIRGGSVCTRALTDPAALGAASLLVLARSACMAARSCRLEREPACPKAARCAHSPRDPRLRATRPSP